MDLQQQVQAAYSQIAIDPVGQRLFPCGRQLAENLGYPADLLDRLPQLAVEAFCGVGSPSLTAQLDGSEVLLDLGCGAGLDTLVAARRAGQVIGIDFSPTMLARAQSAAVGADNVRFLPAQAQSLPLAQASVDVVLVNGLFNLSPYRWEIFVELTRVLRPGGRAYVSELVLLPQARMEASPANWFT